MVVNEVKKGRRRGDRSSDANEGPSTTSPAPRPSVEAPRPAPSSPASVSGGRSAARGFRRDRFTPVLIGLAALGGALVLARQAAYGVSVSFDSINYLAVAEHLLDGRGFLNYDWGAYAHHPPLYPLLLVTATLGVFEPIRAAGALNGVLFAATILVVGRYLRRRVGSGWLACWGAGAVALSPPLGDVGSWVFSETAFILFTTLGLAATDDFLTEGRKPSLLWAAVFCALAWQTRYIGIVVPAVAASALWFASGAAPRDRIRRSGFVLVAAGLPMALWMVRNYFIVGHFTGEREFRATSLTERLAEVRDGLFEWFAFEVPGGTESITVLLAFAAFAGALFAQGRGPADGGREPRPGSACLSPAIFLGFGAVYLFFVVAAAFFVVTGHGVESRFLAPLYVPFVVASALAADRAFRSMPASWPGDIGAGRVERRGWQRLWGGRRGARPAPRFVRAALAAVLFSLLLGLVGPALGAVREANSASPRSWRGFTAPPWDDSPTLRYLYESGFPGEVWTNFPILLYLNYGMRAFFRYLPTSAQWPDWMKSREPGASVVWFRHTPPNAAYDYRLGDLLARAGLEPVARFYDGVVFRVNPDYSPSDPYRTAAASIASGAAGGAIATSEFDLFFDGTNLFYFREPCVPEDIESRFFLHAYPADPAALSPGREPYGFENLDFSFTEYGTRFDGKCVAIVEVPGNGLLRIRTGQYRSGELPQWSVEVSLAESAGARSRAEQGLSASETLRYFRVRARSGGSDPGFPEPRADERWQDYRARALGAGTLLLRLGPGSAVSAEDDGPGAFSGAVVEPATRFIGGAVFRVAMDGAPDPYRSAADLVTSGTAGRPVAHGEFDIFLGGTTLLYFREPCDLEDTEPRFFLHAYPADPAGPTPSRESYGFEKLDFSFSSCGERVDGRCVAVVALPEVPLPRVRTGQYRPGGPPLWEAEFSFSGEGATAPGAGAETTRRLRAHAVAAEVCSPPPTAPRLAPRDSEERSRGPAEPGREVPEWDDWIAGAEPGALVVWFRDGASGSSGIPRLGVVETLVERTGLEPVAWLSDGAVFRVNPAYAPDGDRAVWDYLTSGAAGGARAASEFDLYLDGTTLFYLREPCAPEDTSDRFFLHVYAGDTADLPASRVRYRFENRDFWFSDAGRLSDGKCLASIRLPDYRITGVRTGQYRAGEGEIWSVEFLPGPEVLPVPR